MASLAKHNLDHQLLYWQNEYFYNFLLNEMPNDN